MYQTGQGVPKESTAGLSNWDWVLAKLVAVNYDGRGCADVVGRALERTEARWTLGICSSGALTERGCRLGQGG